MGEPSCRPAGALICGYPAMAEGRDAIAGIVEEGMHRCSVDEKTGAMPSLAPRNPSGFKKSVGNRFRTDSRRLRLPHLPGPHPTWP